MNIVLLGVGVGLISLLPPGPVNLALVQFGARSGRRPALHGAVGVIGGDSVLGAVAVLILAGGAALPTHIVSTTQVAAAALLVALGVVLVARPASVASSVERIHRPARSFFLLTSLTPTALGSWVALLAAMPFATDTTQLGLFTVGVLLASGLWHPMLGLAASTLGTRLDDRGQQRLSRIGGVAMALLGASLALHQLL